MEHAATCHISRNFFHCVTDNYSCPSYGWILTGGGRINQGIMKLAVVTFHLHHTKFDARARRSIAIVFYLRIV